MTPEKRYKQAEEKAKESSKGLFKEKSIEIEEEFKNETILGHPDNLIKQDNKDE